MQNIKQKLAILLLAKAYRSYNSWSIAGVAIANIALYIVTMANLIGEQFFMHKKYFLENQHEFRTIKRYGH